MEVFDELFFKATFHKYYDSIYTGFYKKTGSSLTAQELTQITFIKFWQYRHSFTFELSTELQLNRKAKLVLIDWLRKEAYQRKLVKEMQEYSIIKIERDRFELTDTLKKAIEKLPPARLRVFKMAYIEGFSHKEIAENLNVSVKTVDNHILKALQTLRKLLALYAVLHIIT